MSTTLTCSPPIHILLVDDDPADVLLTKKAIQSGKICNTISVARDGIEAMRYVRGEDEFVDAPRPDLILLDLNMPRKDGRETLAELKADEALKNIPVVVLTTSNVDRDVVKTYNLQANCYVTKPVDFSQFATIVRSIEGFAFNIVRT